MLENTFISEELDFDEFLAQQFDKESDNEIISEDAANYYIGRIKKNKTMKELYKNRAKEILKNYESRVNAWMESKINALDSDDAYCLDKLQPYYEKNANNNAVKLRFPEGSIGYYKVATKVDINKDEVIKYLESNFAPEQYSDFMKKEVQYKLESTPFKKAVNINENDLTCSLDGMIIPGVTITPSKTVFNIR